MALASKTRSLAAMGRFFNRRLFHQNSKFSLNRMGLMRLQTSARRR
jgi:hypothetical protein